MYIVFISANNSEEAIMDAIHHGKRQLKYSLQFALYLGRVFYIAIKSKHCDYHECHAFLCVLNISIYL